METKRFKPFDKVIVRLNNSHEWQCDFYSHQNSITNHHVTVGYGEINDGNILPFEEYSHLLGTTEEPDEEVRLITGENIVALTDNGNWIYAIFLANLCMIDKFEVQPTNGRNIRVEKVVRFSDFNPEDMEETKKHILCVKNGRIVRHKAI